MGVCSIGSVHYQSCDGRTSIDFEFEGVAGKADPGIVPCAANLFQDLGKDILGFARQAHFLDVIVAKWGAEFDFILLAAKLDPGPTIGAETVIFVAPGLQNELFGVMG